MPSSGQPIIGLILPERRAIGASYHEILWEMAPIFRETMLGSEISMPLHVMSNVDGPPDVMEGSALIIDPLHRYRCLVFSEEDELRALLSMRMMSSISHLSLLDKYLIPMEGLFISYLLSMASHNEMLLTMIATRPPSVPVAASEEERAEIEAAINSDIENYPDERGIIPISASEPIESIHLQEAIVKGLLHEVPNEMMDAIISSISGAAETASREMLYAMSRYISSSSAYAHLCLRPPFLHYMRDDRDSMLSKAIKLLYHRDMLIARGLIPFESSIVVGSLSLILDSLHWFEMRGLFGNPWLRSPLVGYRGMESYSAMKIASDFRGRLIRESSGLLGPSFPWLSFNLTGSTIFSLLLGTHNHQDYDIIYMRGDAPSEEMLMAVYDREIRPLYPPGADPQVEVIHTPKSFRLKIRAMGIRDMDLYNGSIESVGRYHSAPTNAFYDGENVCLYPRAFHCLMTGIISDICPMAVGALVGKRLRCMEKYPFLSLHIGSSSLMEAAQNKGMERV